MARACLAAAAVLLLVGCQQASVRSEAPAPRQASPLPSLPPRSAPPFSLDEPSAVAAMEKWMAAYNGRDEEGFFAFMSDYGPQYIDCDFTAHQEFSSNDLVLIRNWVRGRWALDDHIEVLSVKLGGGPSGPGAGIKFRRSNRQLAQPYTLENKLGFRGARIDEAARRGIPDLPGTLTRWLISAVWFAYDKLVVEGHLLC